MGTCKSRNGLAGNFLMLTINRPTTDNSRLHPGLKCLYVSAQSATVTIFQSHGKSLSLLASLEVPHAHTVSVDPKTHLVYFPLENLDGHPVLRIMEPAN